jgi:hypothetical protein
MKTTMYKHYFNCNVLVFSRYFKAENEQKIIFLKSKNKLIYSELDELLGDFG